MRPMPMSGGRNATRMTLPTSPRCGKRVSRPFTVTSDIDARLAGREWFADSYSAVDPYGLVFYTWGVRRELPVGELKNYTALDRMLQRPAVQRALADEEIKV